MTVRRTLTWIAVAALGVGLTTAMTITTTLLSQQPVALASEPLSAGNALVPQRASAPAKPMTTVARRVKKAKGHHHVAATPNISPPVLAPRVVVPLLPASAPTKPRVSVPSRARGASSGDGAGGEQQQAHDSQSGQDNADD